MTDLPPRTRRLAIACIAAGAVLLALVALGLAGAGPASAAAPPGGQAPPGLAGADQYIESVPGSRGNTVLHAGPGSHRGPAVAALPPAARRAARALERRGVDGPAAVAVAAAGAARERSPQPAQAPLRGSGDNPVAAVMAALTGASDDGGGAFLPVTLVLVTLAAGGLVLWRRTRPGA
jgi:hypothetical protein